MIKKRLSAPSTYFTKWFVPPVFGATLVALLTTLYYSPFEVDILSILFAIFYISCAIIACWYSYQIKEVSVDENFLYVSNYIEEVALPLTQVKGVNQINVAANIRPIVIDLNTPSKFGSKIMFAPPLEELISSKEAPVVSELIKLLSQNKNKEE